MPRRILFVIDVMRAGGGAQKILPFVAQTLCKQGMHVSLVVLKKSARAFEIEGLPVRYILEHEEHKLLEHSMSIFSALIAEAKKADVMVSFMDFITCYFVSVSAKAARIPYYVFVRCEPSFFVQTFSEAGINHKIYSLCLEHAQKVVCNSAFVANDVEQNFGVRKERISLLYNPVDGAEIATLASAPFEYEQDCSMLCVAIGRLNRYKNYAVLFEAFRILPSCVHLVILGDGEEYEQWQGYIQQHGLFNISLMGFVQNIYPILKRADVLIHPSLSEGFPNVVLEAAALAKPLILSDIPVLHELFKNRAVFFNPHDFKDLAQKIQSLDADCKKRQALGERAQAAIGQCSYEHFDKSLMQIFA